MFHIALILFCCLVITFIALTSYTFWTRARNSLWNRYREKFRDIYLSHLLHFLEVAKEPEDAEKVITKVRKRTKDLVYFLELIDELSEIIKGEESEKLGWLIRHPLFHRFYKKRLLTSSVKKQLLSCLYFEKCGIKDDVVITRLIKLSSSGNVKLAYAATKALQASEELPIRSDALFRFLVRNDPSDLMFGELIHLFYRDGEKSHTITTSALKEMLVKEEIPPDQKKIIVIYFTEQNFYEYSDILFEYLQNLTFTQANKPLILSLINALGVLEVVESVVLLKKYADVNDPDVRLASIRALSNFNNSDNLQFIQNKITDVEFEIRKEVIEILLRNPGQGHEFLQNILLRISYYMSNIGNIEHPSSKELDRVKVFNSITKGIRILTNKRKKYRSKNWFKIP